jgi:hypothetical protein
MARRGRMIMGQRTTHLVLLGLLPPAIIIFVPLLNGWGDALPPGVMLSGDRREASAMLADLSKDLAALALAVLVGVGILLREGPAGAKSLRFRAAALVALALALISIFASIRFRFAIAEQTLRAELMLDQIIDRLAVQAGSLLAAVSLLLVLTGATLLAEQRNAS